MPWSRVLWSAKAAGVLTFNNSMRVSHLMPQLQCGILFYKTLPVKDYVEAKDPSSKFRWYV
jgi:hypothetical protein